MALGPDDVEDEPSLERLDLRSGLADKAAEKVTACLPVQDPLWRPPPGAPPPPQVAPQVRRQPQQPQANGGRGRQPPTEPPPVAPVYTRQQASTPPPPPPSEPPPPPPAGLPRRQPFPRCERAVALSMS